MHEQSLNNRPLFEPRGEEKKKRPTFILFPSLSIVKKEIAMGGPRLEVMKVKDFIMLKVGRYQRLFVVWRLRLFPCRYHALFWWTRIL